MRRFILPAISSALLIGLLLAVPAYRSAAKRSPSIAKVRVRNVGAYPIGNPEFSAPTALRIGTLAPGAQSDYLVSREGAYHAPAVRFIAKGKPHLQTEKCYTGAQPMQGQAFTYEVRLNAWKYKRLNWPYLDIVKVTRDK